jgi:hypothetical protein
LAFLRRTLANFVITALNYYRIFNQKNIVAVYAGYAGFAENEQ